MKKRLRYILLFFLIIIGIATYILTIHVAPYAITQPQKIHLAISPESLGLESETITIKVADSLQLKGYWIHAKTPEAKGIMILVHGIGGCKEHFLGLAEKLANQGIASIVFDGRAHGESDGKFCTYGYYEKQDISKIVDFIKKENPKLSIGIWGNSLGGAIAIQALENEKRIEFGVIESTFTALDQIVYEYQKRFCKGIGLRFITDVALQEAGKIANFNPDKVKPINSVKNIQQPIFIAHGDSDENIHYTYGEQLYKNVASAEKEFVLVKGGGHFDLFAKGGKDYERKLMSFVHQQFDKE